MKNEKPDFKTDIVTPMFRVSYPNVREAKMNPLSKRMEYSLNMLFDKKTAKTDLAKIKELTQKVATHKWGAKLPRLENPFRDGDIAKEGKEVNPTEKGMYVVRCWSKNPPGVVNASNEVILNHDEIYGGCFCRASVNVYAWEYAGKFGINLGLGHIQKLKDGDPFGSRTRVEDAFAPVAESESMAEETNDMFS